MDWLRRRRDEQRPALPVAPTAPETRTLPSYSAQHLRMTGDLYDTAINVGGSRIETAATGSPAELDRIEVALSADELDVHYKLGGNLVIDGANERFLRIATRLTRMTVLRKEEVPQLTVRVPLHTSIELDEVEGRCVIGDTEGDLILKADDGEITIGTVRSLDLTAGSAQIDVAGVNGTTIIRCEDDGRVTVRAGYAPRLRIECESGTVEFLGEADVVEIVNEEGTVTLERVSEELTVEAEGGTVTIKSGSVAGLSIRGESEARITFPGAAQSASFKLDDSRVEIGKVVESLHVRAEYESELIIAEGGEVVADIEAEDAKVTFGGIVSGGRIKATDEACVTVQGTRGTVRIREKDDGEVIVLSA